MNGFDEIQDMWLQQPLVNAPQVEETRMAIKKYRRKMNRVFIFQICMFLFAFSIFVFLFLGAPAITITTRIGILLFLITISYGTYLKVRTITKNKQMQARSAREFISHLEEEKIRTCTGSVNEQAASFMLLCIAYIFYIYGWLSQNIAALIITYAVVAVIFSLLWFVLRPYKARKRQKTIESLITKLEKIKTEEL